MSSMHRRFHFAALASAAVFGSTRAAMAQTVLERWNMPPATGFGGLVRAAGDVDGDGERDILVTSTGQVSIISGATHQIVRTLGVSTPNIGFASTADASGDVDGDGFCDVIVGAPNDDFLGNDSGTVWVFSGRTGQVLWLYHGQAPLQHVGTHVAFVGDVDADGHEDFAISAPQAPVLQGQLRVYSGRDGVLMNTYFTYDPSVAYGTDFELIADLDGDGLRELAVQEQSAVCCQPVKTLHVLSLPSGAELLTISDDGATSFADASDVDGDGTADIVIGFSAYNLAAHFFQIYSGTSGALIAEAPQAFPFCCADQVFVSGAADLDGDGLAQEFLMSWPNDPASGSGSVYAFRGADQLAWMYPVGPQLPSGFGATIDTFPDSNGDGFDEVLIGAPPSQVLLMSAFALPPQSYCTAKTNSLGCVPTITANGYPDINGPFAFVPAVSNVVNQKSGLFAWSYARQAIPFQGGTLCVASPIRRSPPLFSGGSASGSDCSGTLSFNITPMFIWLHGWQLGDELFGQFWYRDPAHPDGTGVGLSDALSFRVSL
jgi:hypothetical protein